MATRVEVERKTTVPVEVVPNGAALAAFLSAGIGSFVMGLLLIVGEADLWSAPTVYEPVGGLSGRVTITVAAWLASWLALHFAWREKSLRERPIYLATFALIGLGILGTFPPVWVWF